MRRRSLGAAVLAAGALALTWATPATTTAASAASRPVSGTGAGTWRIVPLPTSVTAPAVLDSVTAINPFDAWAVGGESVTSLPGFPLFTGPGVPLILHWDGRAWAKASLPAVTWSGTLTSVSASSPRNAWSVGRDTTGLSHVLHWNGRAWRPVAFPGDADTSLTVESIAAGPAGTAWLVGERTDTSTLIERWDGHEWHVVPSPLASGHLRKVRVTPRGDVWITGDEGADTHLLPNPFAVGAVGVVLHRHGGSWTTLTTQSVTTLTAQGLQLPVSGAALDDVLPVSPDDIWAVGWADIRPSRIDVTRPLAWIGHWNGAVWDSSLQVPNDNLLIGVNNTVTPDITGKPQWAGSTVALVSPNPAFAHFDGTTWTTVTGTLPATQQSVFASSSSTAHIPGTNATWGVTATQVDTATGVGAGPAVIELNTGR